MAIMMPSSGYWRQRAAGLMQLQIRAWNDDRQCCEVSRVKARCLSASLR